MGDKHKPCPQCGGSMHKRLGQYQCSNCDFAEDLPNNGLPGSTPATGSASSAWHPERSSVPEQRIGFPPLSGGPSGKGGTASAVATDALEQLRPVHSGWIAFMLFGWLCTLSLHWISTNHSPQLSMGDDAFNSLRAFYAQFQLAFGTLAALLIWCLPYILGVAWGNLSLGRRGRAVFGGCSGMLLLAAAVGLAYIYCYAAQSSAETAGTTGWYLLSDLIIAGQVVLWGAIAFRPANAAGSQWRLVAVPACYLSATLLFPAVLAGVQHNQASARQATAFAEIRQASAQALASVGFDAYPQAVPGSFTIAGEGSDSSGNQRTYFEFRTSDSGAKVLDYYESLALKQAMQVKRGYLKQRGTPSGDNERLFGLDAAAKKAVQVSYVDFAGVTKVSIQVFTSIAPDYSQQLERRYNFTS